MKKFAKIIIVLVALALCLCSAYTPTITSSLRLAPANDNQGYNYTAPMQDSTQFESEAVGTYDLADWNYPSDSRLDSQQVSINSNGIFHDQTYPNRTLTNAELNDRTPYAIVTKYKDTSANGGFTTSAITLPANGYYKVQVDYHLKNQTGASVNAFGTFYLNDKALKLNEQGWNTATYFVKTDLLTDGTVEPKLYFGAELENAIGSIYFDNFRITAINAAEFAQHNAENYINLTLDNEYELVKSFDNTSFSNSNNASSNSISDASIRTASIPGTLGFNEQQHNFYNKDGKEDDKVMLIAANNSNAVLDLNDYTLQVKSNEVYMFQFYSIATSSPDFSGFYFVVDPTEATVENATKEIIKASYLQIGNLSSQKYHNGWQLNTIFWVGGHDDQDFNLGFSLAKDDAVNTGWACIDDFKIYRVSGDYAQNNASATGVHSYNNLNTNTEPTIANGYFELGTASSISNPTYPYPLKVQDWFEIENFNNNGIVNLNRWYNQFGNKPNLLPNMPTANNNIYMMHNLTATNNVVASPAFTLTAGETNTISFDAYTTVYDAYARIFTADTNEDGELSSPVYIGNAINISVNRWGHYEFTIAEDQLAVSRSYYLMFEMNGIGYTYIDNVTKPDYTTNDATKREIDLSKPLTLESIWEYSDSNLTHVFDQGSLTITNENGCQATIKNTFAYNLTKDLYYEFIITASGHDAYLNLSDYEGLLSVDSTDKDEYKLYLKVENITAPLFQIILGSTDEDNHNVVGTITIDNIQVNQIEQADFEEARSANTENSHTLFLTENEADEETDDTQNNDSDETSFFGKNWWYLIPSLITAIAAILAITAFLLRKIKFEKHITQKHTSYARDMRLKQQHNKIVAQKAAKVDNVIDETHSN